MPVEEFSKSIKTLYHGGQKSGKSLRAEQKALSLSDKSKPYYIATYDNSYEDTEMLSRIETHQSQRRDDFITIEEPLDLTKVIKAGGTYLIDCISMWILNHLDDDIEVLLAQLDSIMSIDAHIVMVLNDVGSGVIPMDAQSRRFVDYSGMVGQHLARLCDEVYEVKLGLEIRLK